MTNFGLFSKIEQNSLFEELFLKKKNKALIQNDFFEES
jgi:hypothetical protein